MKIKKVSILLLVCMIFNAIGCQFIFATPETTRQGETLVSSEKTEVGTTSWINYNEKTVDIYECENLTNKIIATLEGGTIVTITKNIKNGIYQVKLSDDKIGYVASEYVTILDKASKQEYIVYQVKFGDSLWEIARKFLGSGSRYDEIKKFNELTSDNIALGKQLKIPLNKVVNEDNSDNKNNKQEDDDAQYVVKTGDSLWKIAVKYLGAGKRYVEIKSLNGLTSDTIQLGQVLKLPKV